MLNRRRQFDSRWCLADRVVPARVLWACALLVVAAGIIGCDDEENPNIPPEDPPFTIGSFPVPSQCVDCHPNHVAEWETSMHAYAFEDPLFFAANFAEQQHTNGALGQFCIDCHSPIGPLTGTTTDFFDPEKMPEVVRAGVSCMVCHFMRSGSPGATEEGTPVELHPGDTFFGPLPDSENLFHKSQQNLEFENSSLCRSCHNLTVRGLAVERTFDEWEDSIYASRGDSHCQDCHMPSYQGEAAVGGVEREVHRHFFTGVDVAFTDFPGRARSIERVRDLLENSVRYELEADATVAPGGVLAINARVTNDQTGHAVPSGTSFSRQMWVEVIVRDGGGSTLYVSGDLDANGDLRDRDSELDPDGDTDLTFFGSRLELPPGGGTVFTATDIESNLIEANETKIGRYMVPIPSEVVGPLTIETRLRFRAFPPYKARALGRSDIAAEILIFEMATASTMVVLE